MNIAQWLRNRRSSSVDIGKAYIEAARRRRAWRNVRRKHPCRGIVGPRVTHEWRWVNPPAIVQQFASF